MAASSSPSSINNPDPNKRRHLDVMNLMMIDKYKVKTDNKDEIYEIFLEFHGPKESLYEGGVWKIKVELPILYPYVPPIVIFVDKIFHPNIDIQSGSICMDLLVDKWSYNFNLVNIFEMFIPQLLLDPNPEDPFNPQAAKLMVFNRTAYDELVKFYVSQHATPPPPAVEKKSSEEETDRGTDDDNNVSFVDPTVDDLPPVGKDDDSKAT